MSQEEDTRITVLRCKHIYNVFKSVTHKTENERHIYEQLQGIVEKSTKFKKFRGYDKRRRDHEVLRTHTKQKFEVVKINNYNVQTGQVQRYNLTLEQQ